MADCHAGYLGLVRERDRMTTIAVDVDNTLYNFEAAARQAYIELAEESEDTSLFRGAYNPWTEWRSMSDCCGEEACFAVIDKVHHPDVIAAQTPYPQAVEVLWELVNEGYKLHYISNRSNESFAATERWLIHHNLPLDHNESLTCNLRDKVSQVSECQFIIDDRPKTLVQFVYDPGWVAYEVHKSGAQAQARHGFGLAFPFNQNLTDVPGISLAPTWSGIRHYLRKRGVLRG